MLGGYSHRFVLAWFVLTSVLPYAIGAVLAWRAWPAIRARLVETGALAHDSVPGDAPLDVPWRVALAGLLGSGIAVLVSMPIGALSTTWSATEAVVRYGDWGALASVAVAIAGFGYAFVVLVAVWRRVRWSRVRARFGLPRATSLRRLGTLATLPWWSWPSMILGIPLTVRSAIALVRDIAPPGAEAAPLTVGTALRDPVWFLASYGTAIEWLSWSIIAIAAYGYALWVATGIVAWFEGGHRAYVRVSSRLADLMIVAALTGLLGKGLWYLLTVIEGGVLALATAPLAWSGRDTSALPLPACISRYDGASPIVAVVWSLLPLLALPVAHRMWGAVRRRSLVRHLGWYPSRREARLLWLTLAEALVWPYQAVENACGTITLRAVPEGAFVAVGALVALLVAGYLARPAPPTTDD